MFIDRPDYYKKSDDEAPKNGDGEEAPKPQDVDNDNVVKDAYIYLSKNRQGRTGRDKVCWIARKTLFYEFDKEKKERDEGSAYTRTKPSDAAASSYEFEQEEAPEVNDIDAPPPADGDDFFANAHEGFDPDFI